MSGDAIRAGSKLKCTIGTSGRGARGLFPKAQGAYSRLRRRVSVNKDTLINSEKKRKKKKK